MSEQGRDFGHSSGFVLADSLSHCYSWGSREQNANCFPIINIQLHTLQ